MKARDLMIPVSDCPRVAEDRSIYDAVVMMEAFRVRFEHWPYRPRVVLVQDDNARITGSVRHLDLLRGLARFAAEATPAPFPAGEPEVWRAVLNDLPGASRAGRVRDIMYTYGEGEYIDGDAPIENALAMLMKGPYLNLVVEAEGATVGILRLSDAFNTLCKEIKKTGMR